MALAAIGGADRFAAIKRGNPQLDADLLSTLRRYVAEAGVSIYQPVNWLTVAAMAAFWLAAQAALWRARARGGARQ